MTNLFDLQGRVAVVTGAASGLGHAAARTLATLGAKVFLLDVDGDAVASVCESMRGQGMDAASFQLDIRDLEHQRAVFDHIVATTGRLDVVFANAGISGGRGPVSESGRVEAVDLPQWQNVLDLNLTGAFKTLQCASRHMKAFGRGRIIVTTSASALAPEPFVSYSYAASKAALNAVVRQLAVEMAGFGVCVNAIAPGPMATGIAGGTLTDAEVQQVLAQKIALGRVGRPEEISGLVALLASDASSFLTGTIIPLGGGYPSAPLAASPPRPPTSAQR